MRRWLLAIAMMCPARTAVAWTFEETAICTLSHQEGATQVVVTFDPPTGLYAIKLTKAGGWQDDAIFQIRFEGPQALTIGTDQHVVATQDGSLSVTDTGFGNVLAGIALNDRMTAMLGDQSATVSTVDAAEPVAAFNACPSPKTS